MILERAFFFNSTCQKRSVLKQISRDRQADAPATAQAPPRATVEPAEPAERAAGADEQAVVQAAKGPVGV